MPKTNWSEEEKKRRRKISIEKYRNTLSYKISIAKSRRKYYLKNKEKWKQYNKKTLIKINFSVIDKIVIVLLYVFYRFYRQSVTSLPILRLMV